MGSEVGRVSPWNHGRADGLRFFSSGLGSLLLILWVVSGEHERKVSDKS